MHDFVVAVTGASGAIYAVRLLNVLLGAGRNIHLTISPAGCQVLRHELDLQVKLTEFEPDQLFPPDAQLAASSPLKQMCAGWSAQSPWRTSAPGSDAERGSIFYHHHQDFSASIASGSSRTGGMVICPCSMGTLAALATGHSSNLIQRAADVHLKERRKLIVVPRETPLGSIQLENMKRLADAGAVVLPAMPGFYHNPTGLHELVDFVVGRICDQLGVRTELFRRWGK